MISWSAGLALIGLVATRLLVTWVARRDRRPGPHVYWAMGLAAFFPAWLVVFVALLGSVSLEPGLTNRIWVLSSALGLLGVIATDAAVRRLAESGRTRSPVTYWLAGVAAFVPAWLISLLGLP
jgi:hypothetical protein